MDLPYLEVKDLDEAALYYKYQSEVCKLRAQKRGLVSGNKIPKTSEVKRPAAKDSSPEKWLKLGSQAPESNDPICVQRPAAKDSSVVKRPAAPGKCHSSTLCVQNSCLQLADIDQWPSRIRVGPLKHHYEYEYVGGGTYKCTRGSDFKGLNEVLWLMKKEDNMWYAFDAPKEDVPLRVPDDKVIFISRDADAHKPGWHTWTMLKTRNHDQGAFQTTLL